MIVNRQVALQRTPAVDSVELRQQPEAVQGHLQPKGGALRLGSGDMRPGPLRAERIAGRLGLLGQHPPGIPRAGMGRQQLAAGRQCRLDMSLASQGFDLQQPHLALQWRLPQTRFGNGQTKN